MYVSGRVTRFAGRVAGRILVTLEGRGSGAGIASQKPVGRGSGAGLTD